VEEAMTDSSLVLKNSGEQTVVQGPDGIIITDKLNPSEQLRLIGGALLIKGKGPDGVGVWKTAITSKGIVADTITTGILNTGAIQIMNGQTPTFRWDTLGLNAYWWNSASGSPNQVNMGRGVRFDKFGIYGYDTALTNQNNPAPIFNPYKTEEGELTLEKLL
jgi:hypothetical protein